MIKSHRSRTVLATLAMLFIGGGIILASQGFFNQVNNSKTKVLTATHDSDLLQSGNQESINTSKPTINKDNQQLTIIGTVLSNETATIYARRNGIVKDVYVDIGDTVQQNQTIVLLLPPGVEGQSNANLYEKQVRVQEAKTNLQTTKQLAQEAIKQAELNVQLKKIDTNTSNELIQMINKISTNIETYQKELDQLQQTHVQQLQNITSDIAQQNEQTKVLLAKTINKVEHIFLGKTIHGTNMYEKDIRITLGLRNNESKIFAIESYRNLKKEFNIYNSGETTSDKSIFILQTAHNTLEKVANMLDYSMPGEDISQQEIDDASQESYNLQTSLLQVKEKLEDLQNNYQTTTQTQQLAVVTKESMIAIAQAELNKTLAGSADAQKLAQQQLDLIKAQQDEKIKQKQNSIAISQAQLNQERATSANDKVLSPFRGVVSKRMIAVGDIVMMSAPMFELIDVNTSLAKKSKREVQFGLPEEYRSLVLVGKEISFTLPEDNTQKHLAIVTRIAPQVDIQTHTITIQAKISDDLTLPHHTRVNVIIDLDKQINYSIPSTSIIYSGQQSFITTLSGDQHLIIIPITVIADDGEFADIQGNIDEHMDVILHPNRQRILE